VQPSLNQTQHNSTLACCVANKIGIKEFFNHIQMCKPTSTKPNTTQPLPVVQPKKLEVFLLNQCCMACEYNLIEPFITQTSE
jgi:hypothetical protein